MYSSPGDRPANYLAQVKPDPPGAHPPPAEPPEAPMLEKLDTCLWTSSEAHFGHTNPSSLCDIRRSSSMLSPHSRQRYS